MRIIVRYLCVLLHAYRQLIHSGNLEQPVCLPVCSWTVGGNCSTWRKPTWTQGDHAKVQNIELRIKLGTRELPMTLYNPLVLSCLYLFVYILTLYIIFLLITGTCAAVALNFPHERLIKVTHSLFHLLLKKFLHTPKTQLWKLFGKSVSSVLL